MAFVFLFIGAILLVVGVRGTQDDLIALLRDLFTGPNNLTFFALAIIAVGALGYIPQLRKLSVAFMVLILISLLIGNQRFFQQLLEQIKQGTSGAVPGSGKLFGQQILPAPEITFPGLENFRFVR